jgi:hypothetical protein
VLLLFHQALSLLPLLFLFLPSLLLLLSNNLPTTTPYFFNCNYNNANNNNNNNNFNNFNNFNTSNNFNTFNNFNNSNSNTSVNTVKKKNPLFLLFGLSKKKREKEPLLHYLGHIFKLRKTYHTKLRKEETYEGAKIRHK